MKKLFFIYLFITVAFANENEKKDQNERLFRSRRLDLYFISGRYLIFDCVKKHYACVDLNSFDICKNMKNSKYKKINMCVGFKKFVSHEKCLKMQRKKIDQNDSHFFCYHK